MQNFKTEIFVLVIILCVTVSISVWAGEGTLDEATYKTVQRELLYGETNYNLSTDHLVVGNNTFGESVMDNRSCVQFTDLDDETEGYYFITDSDLKMYSSTHSPPDCDLTVSFKTMTSIPAGAFDLYSAIGSASTCATFTQYEDQPVNTFADLGTSYDSYLTSRAETSTWCAVGLSSPIIATSNISSYYNSQLNFSFEIRMSASGELSQNEKWGGVINSQTMFLCLQARH